MVAFRKTMLLLVAVAMFASLASAQVLPGQQPLSCTVVAAPRTVRAEGHAELVGDTIMSCTGGVPTAAGATVPKINFRIFLNVNITSWLVSGGTLSESLLLIDEPLPGELADQYSGCTTSPLGIGEEPGISYKGSQKLPSGATQTACNVYQGKFISDATANPFGNALEWAGVPIDPPGTQASRVVRITNVRGAASERGIGGSLIPTELNMFITVTGDIQFLLNTSTVQVAFIQDGLKFSSGFGSFLQCEDPTPGDNLDTLASLAVGLGGTTENPIGITFTERFPSAFMIRNIATTPSNPGAVTDQDDLRTRKDWSDTESGFYDPDFSSTNNLDDAGRATEGTRLMARFNNIPSGASIYVGKVNETADGDYNCETGEECASLVTGHDAVGYGGAPITYASGGSGDTVQLQKVTLDANGNGTAVWEIVQANTNATNDVDFAVVVDFTPNTTAGLPATGVTGGVRGTFAPLSTVVQATTADNQPRFKDDMPDPNDLLIINPCSTSILWPYVTNRDGFDTGFAISNTSKDPFATAGQTGACKIYYYGDVDGTTVIPVDTTPLISPGEHAVWTLSNGGGVRVSSIGTGIAANPGFQGYVIAVCDFQYAHGYGFITEQGALNFAQGYIPLILDESIWNGCRLFGEWGEDGILQGAIRCGGSRTGSRSEPLDQ